MGEERMTQRLREEELQGNLMELKKFQFMQKEKEQMYALSQEILGTRVLLLLTPSSCLNSLFGLS